MSPATPHVGDLRPSQLLYTYGIGAVLDLPQLSGIVLGVEDWPDDRMLKISEPRLLAAVKSALGSQVGALRAPPVVDDDVNPFDEDAQVGVPIAPFPRWLRCPACRLLAPVDSGLFKLKEEPFRPDRVRYVHDPCPKRGRPPAVLAARFLLACRAGHHDDFPWIEYTHRGAGSVCSNPLLQLDELGSGGQAVEVRVSCRSCQAERRMSDAFGDDAQVVLPRCRGRHPHLGTTEDCDEEVRTLLLGASNAWFPSTITVLSVPSEEGVLEQLIEDRWAVLETVSSREVLEYALGQNPELARLREYEVAEVWAAIEARQGGQGSGGEDGVSDLLHPEWEVLINPAGAPDTEDFSLSGREPPAEFADSIEAVVLAERLREVVALTGFTRIDAPDDTDLEGVLTPRAPLSRMAPRWVPTVEVRGEGIFLRLPEERVNDWEEAYAGSGRFEVFENAYAQWRKRRNLDASRGFPRPRYLLLHSLAHALTRELALECGYGAASIRERIYSTDPELDQPMAGLLLYTAAPDSEGTLGGLVSLGEPDQLGRLLSQALLRAGLCSSDPLCSEHDPRDDGSVHGAACHACQFAAETSCEKGNRFLDRAALVETFSRSDLAYFGG